jgi:hypothetical protein
VGKSFAYLLPAIDFAVKQKKRIVISTHDQSSGAVDRKRHPAASVSLSDEFTAVLVKGDQLSCKRRLEQTSRKSMSLFELIARWIRCTWCWIGPARRPMDRWPICDPAGWGCLGQGVRGELPGEKVQFL